LFLRIGNIPCGLALDSLIHDHFLVIQDIILVHITSILLDDIDLRLALSDRLILGSAGRLLRCRSFSITTATCSTWTALFNSLLSSLSDWIVFMLLGLLRDRLGAVSERLQLSTCR
jgi:hypothetical protein